MDLRVKTPDIGVLIQDMLEYFERHGGLYAFVTIKKMIPRYESALFCWNILKSTLIINQSYLIYIK